MFSTLIGRGMSRLDSHSLWHKASWLPCTKRIYYRRPYAIKQILDISLLDSLCFYFLFEFSTQAPLRVTQSRDQTQPEVVRSWRYPETARHTGRVSLPAGTQATSAPALRGGDQAAAAGRYSQALLSLVQLQHYCALIGRELHSDATP